MKGKGYPCAPNCTHFKNVQGIKGNGFGLWLAFCMEVVRFKTDQIQCRFFFVYMRTCSDPTYRSPLLDIIFTFTITERKLEILLY
jgi:hypothetical protein